VTWPIVSPRSYVEYLTPYIGEEEVARITHAADGYDASFRHVSGTVVSIEALYGELGLWPDGIMGRPKPGSGRFFSVREAVR
jgi:hypothetical protein